MKNLKTKNLRELLPEEDEALCNAVLFIVVEKGHINKITFPYFIKNGEDIIELSKKDVKCSASYLVDANAPDDRKAPSSQDILKINIKNFVSIGVIIRDLINNFQSEFPGVEFELMIPKRCVADFYRDSHE